jgi:hypothetical protein
MGATDPLGTHGSIGDRSDLRSFHMKSRVSTVDVRSDLSELKSDPIHWGQV